MSSVLLITLQLLPKKVQGFEKLLKEKLLPRLRRLPGIINMEFIVDVDHKDTYLVLGQWKKAETENVQQKKEKDSRNKSSVSSLRKKLKACAKEIKTDLTVSPTVRIFTLPQKQKKGAFSSKEKFVKEAEYKKSVKVWNPPTVCEPSARYCHCAIHTPDCHQLIIAGQIGIDLKGQIPERIEEQTHLAYQNLLAILKANGMGYEDLVSLRTYLTDRKDLDGYRKVMKDIFVESPKPATLLFVAGLFDPRWKIEIEARAAKAFSKSSLHEGNIS